MALPGYASVQPLGHLAVDRRACDRRRQSRCAAWSETTEPERRYPAPVYATSIFVAILHSLNFRILSRKTAVLLHHSRTYCFFPVCHWLVVSETVLRLQDGNLFDDLQLRSWAVFTSLIRLPS